MRWQQPVCVGEICTIECVSPSSFFSRADHIRLTGDEHKWLVKNIDEITIITEEFNSEQLIWEDVIKPDLASCWVIKKIIFSKKLAVEFYMRFDK